MLLDLKEINNKALAKQLAEKANKREKATPQLKKGGDIATRIKNICVMVQNKLGHYRDVLEVISTKERLHEYITSAIEKGIISIDTETTGLDPITDKIVGACIYTRGEKPAYIPINHIALISKQRVEGQLTEEQVREEFQRLVDANTKCIFFNAKFDIRVMRHQLGVYITPAHCGFIAAKCLKNNEPEANLKYLWKKYCCPPDFDEPALTFDKMFEGLNFALIPIDTGYLYAAKDALMTLELYDFQMQYLDENNPKCQECNLQKVAKLYREIELPIINITADIEDVGVTIDTEYGKKLSEQYNEKLKEAEQAFYNELDNYKEQLDSYLQEHPKSKIETPMNINSPDQVAELFYDVLKQPVVKKKEPRGTGKDILKAMGHPLGKLILDYKEIAKLLSTYIDKLPEQINKKTGRIHCSFNQYGTDTGRYSSNNPNLQNIPSHNKDIRPMFIGAREKDIQSNESVLKLLYDDIVPTLNGEVDSQDLTEGTVLICKEGNIEIESVNIQEPLIYVKIKSIIPYTIHVKRLHLLIGADYSQQEPKITADLSDDEQFIAQCKAGRDAYGILASIAFNRPYEDCLEFYLDENGNKTHEVNKEGKEIRTRSKAILLGICYSKTIESIAEDLKVTKEKAQEIYDAVLNNISGLRHFMEYSQEFCRKYGYVETKWGRRRYIPDMQLEPYVLKPSGKTFDPFFDTKELGVLYDTDRLALQLIEELKNARYKSQKEKVKLKITEAGFKLTENTKKIDDATRQVVNARVQGSAADQTKIAMRLIGNNERLKELEFKMCLLVHDEIIAECPFATAHEAIPIFKQCMLDAAKDLRSGAACDETSALAWYGKDFEYDDINHETLQKLKQEIYSKSSN